MRIFASARIVVVDTDPERRAELCSAMARFGLLRILPADSLEAAKALAAEAPIDLCVVNAADTPLSPYPFDPVRIPAILIAPNAVRDTVRLAHTLGYRVVLPAPAAPRIVYRRVGSLLQRVRRANRAKPSDSVPAISPVEVVLPQG